MSLFQYLNSKDVQMRDRIMAASAALSNTSIPSDREDRLAAKCWLIYRIVEGVIDESEFHDVSSIDVKYTGPSGLACRWDVSISMARIYFHGLKRGSVLNSGHEELKRESKRLYNAYKKAVEWKPAVLNVLRNACVLSLLTNDKKIPIDAIKMWKETMMSVDVMEFPMRFVEMRDDLEAIWALMAIAHRQGTIEYDEFNWLPKICKIGSHPFPKLMARLGLSQWY